MRQRRLSSWLLVGVAIFVVLGHICAAPLHAHAGAVTTHGEDHPAGGGDEAVHAGSCEALRADFNAHVPALLPTAGVLPPVDEPGIHRARLSLASVAPATSPPLFLLHAALLI